MIIKKEKPPAWIWYQVHTEFEINDGETVYSYGDTLFNPAGIEIDEALHQHELTHSKQQEKCGGPDEWWRKYIADPMFRVEQEIEAYANQYKTYCKYDHDRNRQAKYLHIISSYLASPLYKGNISQSDARIKIKQCKV